MAYQNVRGLQGHFVAQNALGALLLEPGAAHDPREAERWSGLVVSHVVSGVNAEGRF